MKYEQISIKIFVKSADTKDSPIALTYSYLYAII